MNISTWINSFEIEICLAAAIILCFLIAIRTYYNRINPSQNETINDQRS